MSHERPAVAVDRDGEIDEMIRLMGFGVRNALREHKRLGQSIVVWDRENQRVVEVPPEEIVIPEVDEAAPKEARP